MAKASKGDNSGGASPAICILGDRSGRDEAEDMAELSELERRSNRFGRCAIVRS